MVGFVAALWEWIRLLENVGEVIARLVPKRQWIRQGQGVFLLLVSVEFEEVVFIVDQDICIFTGIVDIITRLLLILMSVMMILRKGVLKLFIISKLDQVVWKIIAQIKRVLGHYLIKLGHVWKERIHILHDVALTQTLHLLTDVLLTCVFKALKIACWHSYTILFLLLGLLRWLLLICLDNGWDVRLLALLSGWLNLVLVC